MGEMLSKKKQEEIAFNRRYSRFKVQIFFKTRSPITHYGQERFHCTVAQIRFGHIKQVVFERDRGLKDCIDRISLCERLYGKYQTALVYDRRRDTKMRDGTVQMGSEIRKYVCGVLTESEDVIFTENDKRIVTDVVIKEGIFSLVPQDNNVKNIDFKKEVTNNLNKNPQHATSAI